MDLALHQRRMGSVDVFLCMPTCTFCVHGCSGQQCCASGAFNFDIFEFLIGLEVPGQPCRSARPFFPGAEFIIQIL